MALEEWHFYQGYLGEDRLIGKYLQLSGIPKQITSKTIVYKWGRK